MKLRFLRFLTSVATNVSWSTLFLASVATKLSWWTLFHASRLKARLNAEEFRRAHRAPPPSRRSTILPPPPATTPAAPPHPMAERPMPAPLPLDQQAETSPRINVAGRGLA